MQEIVKESQNRFDYWIMREWKVLPTDERFINLTFEQKDFLWENFLLDNPDIQKRIENRFHDPEFDKEWDNLDSEDTTDEKSNTSIRESQQEPQQDIQEIESTYSKYLESREDLQLEEHMMERLRELQEKAKVREKINTPAELDLESVEEDDWEEVE